MDVLVLATVTGIRRELSRPLGHPVAPCHASSMPAASATLRPLAAESRLSGPPRSRVTKRCQIGQVAHAVFPSMYAELLSVTGGEAADVA
jgi:hypothetical protein